MDAQDEGCHPGILSQQRPAPAAYQSRSPLVKEPRQEHQVLHPSIQQVNPPSHHLTTLLIDRRDLLKLTGKMITKEGPHFHIRAAFWPASGIDGETITKQGPHLARGSHFGPPLEFTGEK